MPYFGVPIRNGLPIGLGSQAGFGIAPFDPRDLFSAGEQGAWYDPSDYSTLFTDSAGTTPVTAVEQFVGLMLDKSKGAPTTLGAELINNAAWFAQTGWSVNSSTGAATGVAVTGFIRNNGAGSTQLTAGKWYQATIRLVSYTSGSVGYPYDGSGFVAIPNVPGTYTYRFLCDTADYTYVFGTGFTGVIDSISVRELPGNHATQTTSTKRPKLAARYNLLTYSEQFDNGAWTKTNATVTANATVAPDGTTTADKLVSAVGALHERAEQAVTIAASTAYTFTVYAKADGANFAGFRVAQDTAPSVWFDLVNGTVGNVEGNWSAAVITAAGNGWYRCKATYTTVGTSYTFRIFLSGSNGDSIFTGDGIKGLFLWGADLRPTSQATGLIGPTYQRVAAATDYDTVGFLPYLAFDGVDDSMSTGSIDFTATDKMTVFAGVRKLSDAAPILAELSANFNSNAGSFFFSPSYDGVSAAANLAFTSRGNAAAAIGQIAISAGFASPVTLITTATGNIAGDLSALRINGAASGTNGTADQGAGNYGNYPLFIGARNNASLYFQGWLSSLIIRGAQSTDSQISATESWVAGKTGVQLTTQSTISVQNSGGTAYSVLLTVLNSSGNSYTVTNTVLSSNGTSYTV
jgi:hypothetical protein